jgi:hypothetical protein
MPAWLPACSAEGGAAPNTHKHNGGQPCVRRKRTQGDEDRGQSHARAGKAAAPEALAVSLRQAIANLRQAGIERMRLLSWDAVAARMSAVFSEAGRSPPAVSR